MTKTKAQLRAEAVERLRKYDESDAGTPLVFYAIGEIPRSMGAARDALTDLLTDDCGTECYECSKLAELVAENSQLRVKVDKQAEVLDLQQELLDERDVEATTKSSEKDGNDGETNGIAADSPLVDELPEGDAPSEFAEILMRLAADCSCMGDGIVRHFEPKDVQNDVDALMRVVERDYVHKDTVSDWLKAFQLEHGDAGISLLDPATLKDLWTADRKSVV